MQRKVLAFLPYVGGKNNLFAWLKNYIPDGGLPYCEPFVGGGGVFFYRQRAEKEVINDIDSALISVYRAYQLANDGTADAKAFRHMVNYTLYARNELRDAVEIIRMFRNGKTVSEINLAWAKLVAHRLGTGGREARQVGNWGRTLYALKPSNSAPFKLLSCKKFFDFFSRRLAGVVIENMDGGDCILKWDNEDAVFYVDPPYPHSTRRDLKCYSNEMSDEEHKRLVDILLSCKGAVVVSSYPNPIYNVLLENGWLVFKKETF